MTNHLRNGLIGLLGVVGVAYTATKLDEAATQRTQRWIEHNADSVVERTEQSLDYELNTTPQIKTDDTVMAGEYDASTNTIYVNPSTCRRPSLRFTDLTRFAYPYCKDVIQHETGHAITKDVAGRKAMYQRWNHKSPSWQYVTEGIAEWVDETTDSTAYNKDCSQWPPRTIDPPVTDFYGCGERLVTPVLNTDMENGIKQLYKDIPTRKELQQPTTYINNTIEAINDRRQ